MRLRYLAKPGSVPLPSLGGSTVRHRPVIAVRASGPTGFVFRDGLADTGADDTVLPDQLASLLGVDLTQAPQVPIYLVGRGVINCRYAEVTLQISDLISETYEWEAVVGFSPVQFQMPLLGHAGCLQFFDVTFLGADRETILLPNRSFPGRRI